MCEQKVQIEETIDIPLQFPYIVFSVGTKSGWMPERRRPVAVWSRERRVDWVEAVVEERVVDPSPVAIGARNGDLSHGDHLRGWNHVPRPVPEGLAEVGGGLLPAWLVNCIGLCDICRVLLQYLLIMVVVM